MLSTRVYFSFVVHKLANFSSNPDKVHFEGLVHLLRYISYNNTLVLRYYDYTKDAPLSGLVIQGSINNENQLMDFSDSSWQDFPDTDRSTGSYMIFYQDSPMDHETHVRVPVAQSSAES